MALVHLNAFCERQTSQASAKRWYFGIENAEVFDQLKGQTEGQICKATTVTHTKRIYRNLLRKETSFVYYTSSVLRKSRHMKQKEKITHCR